MKVHLPYVIIIAALFLFPVVISAQTAVDTDPFIAVVLKVTGAVQVRRADKEELVPLKRDDRVYPGDRIICGKGGYASLLFADSAVEIKLFPDSDLTLQGQRTSQNIVKRIFLPVGRLLSKVLRGNMEVVTPTSVASVKGTEWWTLVQPSTLTQIIVMEGEVEVEHRTTGQTEVVTAGNTAVATPEGQLEVKPSGELDLPEEPGESNQGSLDVEFEDGSGGTKTLHIEFEQ